MDQLRFKEERKMVSEKEEEIVVFRNCRLLRNHAIVKEDLWVRRGKIIDPGEGWSQLSKVHIFFVCYTFLGLSMHFKSFP